MTDETATEPVLPAPEAAEPEAPRVRVRPAALLSFLAIAAFDAAVVVGVPIGWENLPPRPAAEIAALEPRHAPPRSIVEVPPPSDPEALLQITAEDAQARNAAIPIAAGANPAAEAFHLTNDEISRLRSIDCLTAAVYYEAGLEPTAGQQAVAQVVLNRVRHPAYPNTVCGVVFQGSQRRTGCQFTFTCDGALRRTPVPAVWERSRRVAEAALSGFVYAPVGLATHYHANYVFPYWAPTLTKVAEIGAHIFYRWGPSGRLPGAYTERYAGGEPDIRWRGGFGQNGVPAVANTPVVPGAPAVPGAPGQPAPNPHSIDSFQSAILRRYEAPLQQESANRLIREQVQAQPTPPSASSRWALTGEGSGRPQAQLGRPERNATPPADLGGVRRRPEAAPATNQATPAPQGR